MSKPPFISVSFRQLLRLVPLNPGNRRHNHLGDPLAPADLKTFLAQINENYLDFSPVVAVDGSGSIQASDAMPDGQAAPGAHLGLIAFRQGNGQAGGDFHPLSRRHLHRLLDSGHEIHPGCPLAHVPRQGQPLSVRENLNLDWCCSAFTFCHDRHSPSNKLIHSKMLTACKLPRVAPAVKIHFLTREKGIYWVERLKKIAGIIGQHDRFLICSHVNPDGDAIGSCLALKYILEQTGKKAEVLLPQPVPEKFRFLDPEDSIRVYEPGPGDRFFEQAQVHCTLDVSAPKRMGSLTNPLRNAKLVKVLIDHHPCEDVFADYGYVDTGACATGVLIYRLMGLLEVRLEKKMADTLYVAILTDTGGFRFSNTNAEAHDIAARLIEAGAQPQEMYSRVYEQDSLDRFKLMQKVIGTARFTADNRIAWMTCPVSFFQKTGTDNTALEDFVNIPRNLQEVEVSMLFSEPRPGEVRVSMRAKNLMAVNELAGRFGGGGHSRAAGAVIDNMTLDEVVEKVIRAAEEMLAEIAM